MKTKLIRSYEFKMSKCNNMKMNTLTNQPLRPLFWRGFRRGIIAICILLTAMTAKAAESIDNLTVDERLWGTWGLETVAITTGETVKTYALADLFADRSLLPADLFLSLYFFDDQVGACSSGKELVYELDINVKGAFTVNKGQLTISLYEEYEEQPHTFAYAVEDALLKLRYTQAGAQFELTYKLIAKNPN